MTLGAKKKSKNRGGLKNRFKEDVREFWIGWFQDLWDGRNDADCLHHIKSPSSSDYQSGRHNTSVLNSCPLNNFRNHIGNGNIHNKNIEVELILRTLKVVQNEQYVLQEKDTIFLEKYNIIKCLK